MARPTISRETLDLIHMLMRSHRQQYRLLGAYVKSRDLETAENDVFISPESTAMLMGDDCPAGYHEENGVCVPD